MRVAVAALPADPLAVPAGPPPDRVLTAPVADGRIALVVADGAEAERWLARTATALLLEAPLAIGPTGHPAPTAARSATHAPSRCWTT